MGDGSTLSGAQNPQVTHSEGEVSAGASGSTPSGTGNINVRVPVEALGRIACHAEMPGSVSLSILMGGKAVAFSSKESAGPTCVLLVVRNDREHLTITNIGTIHMPVAFGGSGAVQMEDLRVDARVQVP